MSLPIQSTRALVEWLKKQPADGEYDWSDTAYCLIGLYARSLGMTYDGILSLRGETLTSPWEGIIAAPFPSTFGAALERAEAYLKREEVAEVA